MKALVTGGAGFVGSHLVDHLLDLGYEVTVLDNLSTGRKSNLQDHPRLQLNFGSAAYPPIVKPLVQQADIVFHLAAIVGVRKVLELPLETVEQNLMATGCVLNCAAGRNIPVVITSSSEVYGHSDKAYLSESDDLRISPNPRWGYAAAKLAEEFIALARFALKEVPVVITRLFNTIGPRQRPEFGSVVPRMISQALKGEPITIYGDGRQTRSFVWVGDVARALHELGTYSKSYGEIVNIGSHNNVQIRELAELVAEVTNSKSPIRYIPQAEALGKDFEDIRRREPNLSKIQQLIGYTWANDLPSMIDKIAVDMRARTLEHV